MTTETINTDDQKTLYKKLAGHRLSKDEYEKLVFAYWLFGFFDGISVSYSMLKYMLTLYLSNSSKPLNDEIHDFLKSEEGFVLTLFTTTLIVAFSAIANYFESKDEDTLRESQRIFKVRWSQFRDITKGLKNGYKGVRSTLAILEFLSEIAGPNKLNLNPLILPIGLMFGGLSVVDRLWLSSMRRERKKMLADNEKLFKDIQAAKELTFSEIDEFFEQLQKQPIRTKALAYIAATYGGFVDSLYLYIGVLSICALAPPAFIAMAVCCSIYLMTCIITRIYEEYDDQRKLSVSKTEAELALLSAKMQKLFHQLEALNIGLSISPTDANYLSDQEKFLDELTRTTNLFNEKRDLLCSLSTRSYTEAFCNGLKTGLAAYGVITSLMFTVSAILFLSSVAFPPALLLSCVSLGMVALLAAVTHSLIETRYAKAGQTKTNKDNNTVPELLKLITNIKNAKNTVEKIEIIKSGNVKEKVATGAKAAKAEEGIAYQKWCSVFRSAFSGLSKGLGSMQITFSRLQLDNGKGHYQDTPVMFVLEAFSAIAHAIALGIKDYANNFRPKKDDETLSKDKNPLEPLEIPPAEQNYPARRLDSMKSPSRCRSSLYGYTSTNTPKTPAATTDIYPDPNHYEQDSEYSAPDYSPDTHYQTPLAMTPNQPFVAAY